jgi:hypothetical protein
VSIIASLVSHLAPALAMDIKSLNYIINLWV